MSGSHGSAVRIAYALTLLVAVFIGIRTGRWEVAGFLVIAGSVFVLDALYSGPPPAEDAEGPTSIG
jgi:hypothetical protein